jgi:hypothetical protein
MSSSTLVVDEVSMVDNAAFSGAAIRVQSGSNLRITRSVFTENMASTTAGAVSVPAGATAEIGSSVFAKNLQSNVSMPATGATNLGNNLVDSTLGADSFFSNEMYGDHIGPVDYVVTSVADTFDGNNDPVSKTVRDAIQQANEDTGAQEIWLPAWEFTLTRERAIFGGGSVTDTSVAFGDLDIGKGSPTDGGGSLTIRGVTESTSVAWRSGAALDKVFELLGDYNNDGLIAPPADVDGSDYVVWRRQEGMTGTGLGADGNEDGTVNQADFDLWADHYGNTLMLHNIGPAA